MYDRESQRRYREKNRQKLIEAAWDGVAEITATSPHKITIAEVNASKLAVKAGNTSVTSG